MKLMEKKIATILERPVLLYETTTDFMLRVSKKYNSQG